MTHLHAHARATSLQLITGLVAMYEKRLQELNPTVANITYDVKDLNTFIDHFTDFCALV